MMMSYRLIVFMGDTTVSYRLSVANGDIFKRVSCQLIFNKLLDLIFFYELNAPPPVAQETENKGDVSFTHGQLCIIARNYIFVHNMMMLYPYTFIQ